MKIRDDTINTVQLNTISAGQCFTHQNRFYMAVTTSCLDGKISNEGYNAVDLENGKLIHLGSSLDVIPCKTEVVITRKG